MSTDDVKISAYAHPERLVTTQWLAEQIEAGHVGGPDGIALLESDEDVLLYATGHIPGARSAPSSDALTEDGAFRSAEELRARYARLGAGDAEEVAVYCGSGVSAALEVAALRIAGIDAALYPGSWSAWSNRPELPAATGPEPDGGR